MMIQQNVKLSDLLSTKVACLIKTNSFTSTEPFTPMSQPIGS